MPIEKHYMKAVDDLVKVIRRIPGNKALTLHVKSGEHKFNVSRLGRFEGDVIDELMFRCRIAEALCYGGGVVIREFLETKASPIPQANLYGIAFRKGLWVGLNVSDMRIIHEVDHYTLERIPKEPGVHYKSLGKFFSKG